MADCGGGGTGWKPLRLDPSHGEAGCKEGGVQGALILLLLLPALVWYMAGPFVLPVLCSSSCTQREVWVCSWQEDKKCSQELLVTPLDHTDSVSDAQ